jgi:peroxiredoxin Q/BCP
MALLSIGAVAPNFSGTDQDGNTLSLDSLKGNKVVLYFYPKDDTPGCTKEACDLRDNYNALLKAGYKVVGVSVDDAASHKKFIQKYNLPFPLLADTDRKIVEQYGVWGEKSMYGKKYMGTHRVTYIIDGDGKIQDVIDKVVVDAHAQQIMGGGSAAAVAKPVAKKAAAKKAPAKKVAAKAKPAAKKASNKAGKKAPAKAAAKPAKKAVKKATAKPAKKTKPAAKKKAVKRK